MNRPTADCPRRIGARTALATLAVAAIAAAPAVALAEVTHSAQNTISAEPNDVDYTYNVGDAGAGGGGGG